jgi:hypothetical protein
MYSGANATRQGSATGWKPAPCATMRSSQCDDPQAEMPMTSSKACSPPQSMQAKRSNLSWPDVRVRYVPNVPDAAALNNVNSDARRRCGRADIGRALLNVIRCTSVNCYCCFHRLFKQLATRAHPRLVGRGQFEEEASQGLWRRPPQSGWSEVYPDHVYGVSYVWVCTVVLARALGQPTRGRCPCEMVQPQSVPSMSAMRLKAPRPSMCDYNAFSNVRLHHACCCGAYWLRPHIFRIPSRPRQLRSSHWSHGP